MNAAERIQHLRIEGLRAERDAVDAGRGIAFETAVFHRAGIGFHRDLDSRREWQALGHAPEQCGDRRRAEQRRRAAAEENAADFTPSTFIRRRDRPAAALRHKRLGNRRGARAVEIAVRALADAPGQVARRLRFGRPCGYSRRTEKFQLTDRLRGKKSELEALRARSDPSRPRHCLDHEGHGLYLRSGFHGDRLSPRDRHHLHRRRRRRAAYRGYPIEQLAKHSNFLEVSYLLQKGELPSAPELEAFTHSISRHTMLNEWLLRLYRGFHHNAHPMAMVATIVASLAAFYHDTTDISDDRHRESFRTDDAKNDHADAPTARHSAPFIIRERPRLTANMRPSSSQCLRALCVDSCTRRRGCSFILHATTSKREHLDGAASGSNGQPTPRVGRRSALWAGASAAQRAVVDMLEGSATWRTCRNSWRA